MRKKYGDSDNGIGEGCPQSGDTLIQFVDKRSGEVSNSSIAVQIVRRIKQILSAAAQHGISASEVVLMVSYGMGINGLGSVPWGRLDDCLKLVGNYPGDEKYRLFDPVYYAALQKERQEVEAESCAKMLDEKIVCINRVKAKQKGLYGRKI